MECAILSPCNNAKPTTTQSRLLAVAPRVPTLLRQVNVSTRLSPGRRRGGEKTAVGLASPGNEASRRIRNSSAGKRLSAKRLTASVRTFAARALHAIVTFLPLVLIYTFSLVLGFARAHYLDFLVCLHCLCRERLHQRFEKSQFWSYLKNLILWKYNRIVVMFFLDIMKVSINFCKVRIKLSFCTDRNLYSCKPYRQRMFLYFFYQSIKYQVIPIFVHRH